MTFDIDANGILNVTAKDRATNNEQKITISSSSGLSKDEVDRMAKDAESHSADDRKNRDAIEARNRADAMIYNIEKTLKEHRDKVGEEEAKNIEAAIADTKKAMNGGTTEEINAATDKLTAASHKLAEAMYKASSQPTPGGDGGSGRQGPAVQAGVRAIRRRRTTWSTPNLSTWTTRSNVKIGRAGFSQARAVPLSWPRHRIITRPSRSTGRRPRTRSGNRIAAWRGSIIRISIPATRPPRSASRSCRKPTMF